MVQPWALGLGTATGYVTSGKRPCLWVSQGLIIWYITGHQLLASDKTHFYFGVLWRLYRDPRLAVSELEL